MASVDWQKATIQKVGAMIKHNGKQERLKINHSNMEIDKSKSNLNIYIGADDYKPMVEKVKARIKEVDALYPPMRVRKDRITCIMLETPVPKIIEQQGKAEQFLRDAHKVIENFFGKENVGGSVCHFDEVHTYNNSKDGKKIESLIHAHTICCAYAEWTEKNKKSNEIIKRKGINGKHCETRQRLNALNKAMNDMCLNNYGIPYNTGEKPQKKSVERLKEESALRTEKDALIEEISNMKNQKAILEQENRTIKENLDRQKKEQIKNMENLIGAIPPLKLKETPPPPQEPEILKYLYENETLKEKISRNKIQKEYDKALKNYQSECYQIQTENNAITKEWLNTYGTLNNVQKALKQLSNEQHTLKYLIQQSSIKKELAEKELEKIKEDRKKLNQQIENQQMIIQQEVQRKLDEISFKHFKMSFNELLNYTEINLPEEHQNIMDELSTNDLF